jgi:hypothetical protein
MIVLDASGRNAHAITPESNTLHALIARRPAGESG